MSDTRQPDQNLPYATAVRLVAAGISVIPIIPDGKKEPAGRWKQFESRLPDPDELRSGWSGRVRGIAAIGGKVSGGLECLDFDQVGVFDRWADDIELLAPTLLRRLVIVKTPSGGYHCWYRCDQIQGNQPNLARRFPTEEELQTHPKAKSFVVIETRGEGGYALVPGSPITCHDARKPYEYSPLGLPSLTDVTRITPEERQLMLDQARTFNTYYDRRPTTRPRRDDDGITPGDDYDARGPEWSEILGSDWKLFRGNWERGSLTRPGKKTGSSATIGECRDEHERPMLHVFSSNAGIEPGTYGKFRAYAEIHHRGNQSEAAKALAKQGYGTPPTETRNQSKPTSPNHNQSSADSAELVVRSLKGRKAKPVRWLVDRKIPAGKLATIAGVGGMGKSTLVRHLIACLTNGRPAFGLDYDAPAPCDVLLASVEDSPEDTIIPHLMAEGADMLRVKTVEGTKKADGSVMPFDLRDIDLMIRLVEANPAIRLLVIDPIMSFVGRAGLNENSSSEIRTILDPLIGLADRTGVTVLLIAHLNKSSTATAINRIVGTSAFRDACRVVFAVGENPMDSQQRVMAIVKENLPGIDKQSVGFGRRLLSDEEAEAVLSSEEFSELEPDDRRRMAEQLAVIVPSGTVNVDADAALGTSKQEKAAGTSTQRECADWIKVRVGTEYAWPDDEIQRDAERAGFSEATYRKAKSLLGKTRGTGEVQSFQPRPMDPWIIGFEDPKRLPMRPQSMSDIRDGSMSDGKNNQKPRKNPMSDGSDGSDESFDKMPGDYSRFHQEGN
jgi:energy-coupling factor transporter ATP-binding protein EcfA2